MMPHPAMLLSKRAQAAPKQTQPKIA